MINYFQTKWRDGSAFNHNLTSDEFFYNQIYEAVKANVAAGTLPQFSKEPSSMPVELSTGKIINDENLIALEQVAASNKYKSSAWIYGDVLDKLQHDGVKINLVKNAQPALCITKYANPTHLFDNELYIAESGTKTRAQYLYNLDSLDERSQEAVKKHLQTANLNLENYSNENFNNYLNNFKKSKTERVPALESIKTSLKGVCENAASLYRTPGALPLDQINFSSLVNTQARHVCSMATGSSIKNNVDYSTESSCYAMLEKIFDATKKQNIEPWKSGREICNALDAGTHYAKAFTSRDFNFEHKKLRDEINQQHSKKMKRDSEMSR